MHWDLILVAFLTSVLSGVVGMGGGVLLFTYMTPFFAPTTLIPLHGVVQLASNLSRSLYSHSHLRWKIILSFGAGAILGALVGSQFIMPIPEQLFRFGISIFILIVTWAPALKIQRRIPYKFFWVGGGVTFFSLFAGAIGPMVDPFFLREGLKKEQLVATKALCQMITHFFKVMTFFLVGFSIMPYWKLTLAMVAVVFLGSWVGKVFLEKLPEKIFIWVFKLLITALAVRMFIQSVPLDFLSRLGS